MTSATQRRVLVVGDNDLASLAIVRSLGRMGVQVSLVSFEKSPIARSSKYVSNIYRFGHPLIEPQSFCARVVELAGEVSFDLIIPVSDKSLVPLLDYRAELNQRSHLVAPDDPAFRATHDKAETISLARRAGMTVPRTIRLENRADIERFPVPFELPWVLKPSSSVTRDVATRQEVRLVQCPDEYLQRAWEMVVRCPLLVQEYSPGDGVGLSILADNGVVYAAFQHLRIHEPPAGGAGGYRQSVPLHKPLQAMVQQVCQDLRWHGPAMFEFKWNRSTDTYVLMEINGRFWGSLALAINAGVDFPKLLYEREIENKQVEVFQYRHPLYVRHCPRDFWWFLSNLRTPSNDPILKRVPASQLLREIGNILSLRERYDVESWTDPGPAIAGWLGTFRELWEGVAGRVAGTCRERKLRRRLSRTRTTRWQQFRSASSVLFICYGNINRSALAETVFSEILRGTASAHISVASAGFYEIEGRSPNRLSAQIAEQLGFRISQHRSRSVTEAMLADFDVIVAMELSHLCQLTAMQPSVASKTMLLGEFAENLTQLEIPDPFAKDSQRIREIYQEVIDCTRRMAKQILGR